MAGASSNNTLHPPTNQVPKRYCPKRTRQVQYIPPEDVIKLVSGTRVQCGRTSIRKPSVSEFQIWNLRTTYSSQARTASSGSLVSRTNVISHPLGKNQTGKSHQGRIQTPKPPGNLSEGSKSCLPKSKPATSSNLLGVSVDPHQKAGLGVGKKKGQEKTLAHKRKLAHEDGPKNGKITLAAAKGCNP